MRVQGLIIEVGSETYDSKNRGKVTETVLAVLDQTPECRLKNTFD